MSTALLSADQRSFRVGDLVIWTDLDGPDHLAVVADTTHQPTPAGLCRCGCAAGEPSDQVTLLCPGAEGTGNNGVHNVQASTTQLRIPAEPDTQHEQQTRMLLSELVNRCVSGREAAQRETAAAKATITSMRNYAIDRHRDGDICREGLNDFLRHHDLAPYAPTYDVTVDLTLQVTVDCESDEDKGDLGWMIREYLTVGSNDSSRLWVDDFSLGYDAIREIKELD